MQLSDVMEGMHRDGDDVVANVGEEWLQGRSVFGGLQAAIAVAAMRTQVDAALPLRTLQVTFVALLLTMFFTLFGFLAIPEQTAEAWTTLEHVHVYATWQVSGRPLVVTEPLLRVAGFLGAFTGMYFTVVLSTDATYRDEFAEDVAPQIRQALAVRVAYLHHRLRTDPT